MEKNCSDRITGALLYSAAALIVLMAIGAAVAVVYAATMFYSYVPEYRYALWPCAAYAVIGALPCAAALIAFCRLIGLIQSDRSFTEQSEKTVRFIAAMALIVCGYLAAGLILMQITGLGFAGLSLLFMALIPAFLAVGLMALALARLIHRAALLREDSELTV